jgi:transposase
MLAKLLRVDPELLHPIRHGSEQAQRDLLSVKLRDTLVRSRVNAVGSVRSSLKSLGMRLPSPSTAAFPKQARRHLAEHSELLASVEPLLKAIDELSAQIQHYDKAIAQAANDHSEAARFQQISGVGPLTSLTFVLAVEDPSRFEDARDVGAWLGLVPRRDQSGQSDKQLPITKAGNRYLRTLLVQSAQYILGQWGPDCDLRRHGLKLAARGGKAAKKKAVIAIARKLAVLMLVMWQRQSDYEPLKNAPKKQEAPESLAAAA